MIGSLVMVCALFGQSDATRDAAYSASAYSAPWPVAVMAADQKEIDEAIGSRYASLRVIGEQGSLGEPVLGRYFRQGERLVFTPRFKLDPAVSYRWCYVDAAGKSQSKAVLQVSATNRSGSSGPEFKVTQIYPTLNVVPANLLKFYIHFSRPVREGSEIFDLITLTDEQGVAIPAPWLLTELWNEDATRLTLRIHPGRVKQGVNLRETEGMVLAEGKQYTLRVSGKIQIANAATGSNRSLGIDHTKTFCVTAEDHTLPRVDRWQATPPAVQSLEPLVIAFPEPLDPHLARRCVEIFDPAGKKLAGGVVIGKHELTWTFEPALSWQPGEYQIVVDEVLEDLAGNTPTRPFEVDAQAPVVELPRVIRFKPRE